MNCSQEIRYGLPLRWPESEWTDATWLQRMTIVSSIHWRTWDRHRSPEQQVRAFLERHPEFVPETGADYLPEPLRCRCENGMAQLLSHRDHVEGFFIARMRRKGV